MFFKVRNYLAVEIMGAFKKKAKTKIKKQPQKQF